jgi:ABC-2 type transport system ATP-binding protein
MLSALRADGASLLLTTHYLEEAEARCERIVIIDHGRAIAAGTLSQLVEQAGFAGRVVRVSLEHATSSPPAGFRSEGGGTALVANIRDVGSELPGLLTRLQQAGLGVRDLDVRTASLQAVFLQLTGKELRE